MKILISAVFSVLFFGQAFADESTSMSMRDMVYKAIKDGSAEGVAAPEFAQTFGMQTHSSKPLKVKMLRLQKFAGDCAQIRFEFAQPWEQGSAEVLDKEGKPVTFNVGFTQSICMDGTTPKDAIDTENKRREQAMRDCKISIEKGVRKDGDLDGRFKFEHCPVNGQVQISFAGQCLAIESTKGEFTIFNLNDKGEGVAALRLPAKCADAGSLRWNVKVLDAPGLPGQTLGMVVKKW